MLRCCPRLAVLVVGSDVDGLNGAVVPDRVLKTIFAISNADLHTFCIRSPLRRCSVADLLKNLSKFKNIRSLSLRFNDVDSFRGTLGSVVLDELHSLEMFSFDPSNFLDTMSDWKLPALRRVSLRSQQVLEDRKLFAFFEVHGPQLTILEIDCLSVFAPSVLTLCPNLMEIITDITLAVPNRLFGHPSVRRIGFRGFHMVDHRPVRRETIACFGTIFPSFLEKTTFPKIESIRFLDFDQHSFGKQGWLMSEAKLWVQCVRRCREQGVRLEDHDGNLVNIEVADEIMHFEESYFDVR